MTFDSTEETKAHIALVRDLLHGVTNRLVLRAYNHDASKLSPEEKPYFDEYSPVLREVEYDSPEYHRTLKAMAPAIAHHYANNSHHPEHHENGIRDMNLLDIIEMLCDWTASTSRVNKGDIRTSIEKNQHRFGYSDDLKQILLNTVPLLLDS